MTSYLNKMISLVEELHLPLVDEQVIEIKFIIKCLDAKIPLPSAPNMLGIEPDVMDFYKEKLSAIDYQKLELVNQLLNNFRSYISRKYGVWSLANLNTAKEIVDKYNVHSLSLIHI